jgi:hypothetical protein
MPDHVVDESDCLGGARAERAGRDGVDANLVLAAGLKCKPLAYLCPHISLPRPLLHAIGRPERPKLACSPSQHTVPSARGLQAPSLSLCKTLNACYIIFALDCMSTSPTYLG